MNFFHPRRKIKRMNLSNLSLTTQRIIFTIWKNKNEEKIQSIWYYFRFSCFTIRYNEIFLANLRRHFMHLNVA